eukprot:1276752-Pleurochrysis_carterae.AAC.1
MPVVPVRSPFRHVARSKSVASTASHPHSIRLRYRYACKATSDSSEDVYCNVGFTAKALLSIAFRTSKAT